MKNTTETFALSLLANDAGWPMTPAMIRSRTGCGRTSDPRSRPFLRRSLRSFSGAADTVERTRFGKGIGTGTGSGN